MKYTINFSVTVEAEDLTLAQQKAKQMLQEGYGSMGFSRIRG